VEAVTALNNGMNVAAVFHKVPERFVFPYHPDYLSFAPIPVVNGDEHDLRFLDPKGCIVGLKAKGNAKRDTSGFVR
jgi:hypothetical protein